MNRYKLVFEKNYTGRCISKKIQQDIFIESDLDIIKEKELIELGHSKLYNNYPSFFQNIDELNSTGWSKPEIKNIILLK